MPDRPSSSIEIMLEFKHRDVLIKTKHGDVVTFVDFFHFVYFINAVVFMEEMCLFIVSLKQFILRKRRNLQADYVPFVSGQTWPANRTTSKQQDGQLAMLHES